MSDLPSPRSDWLSELSDRSPSVGGAAGLGVVALVLVDMQEGYLSRHNVRGRWLQQHQPHVFETFFDRIDEMVLPNCARLLDAFRTAGLPVVHLRFGWHRTDRADLTSASHREPPAWAADDDDLLEFRVGGREHRIVASLAPLESEWVLDKSSRSAFTSTTFSDVLRRAGASRLIIAGWATDACVDLTARDAVDRGWPTVIVEDATAAFTAEAHDGALDGFARMSGEVHTTSSVIAMIAPT
jgi:nicotinamidase-related amidase